MRRSIWLAVPCALAFALSCAYIWYYLRGGPRIIDATSYFLEARSIANGSFSFPAGEPSASLRGRFLLEVPGTERLAAIFPPGYPLLLALGVRLGTPLLVGPLLAALLVLATYFLARAVSGDDKLAWLSAALSAVCGALRYHTADTMSHGLATLLGCLALGLALSRGRRFAPLLCGLCLGWLLATRPVSAGVSALLCAWSLRAAGPRVWSQLALGIAPGAALLLTHQHALTGSFLGSTQLAYYAAADAPPGCFRYGFGAGVGCLFEHGDFVSKFLPDGYGFVAAARNLYVHLALFCVDATNAFPLTLVAGYAVFRHASSRLGLLGVGVLLQALAYVPFYFDGSYPGGGARFLCEAIPLCQILVARAALDLKLSRWVLPLSLAGFVLHARHGHEKLRDREGGRPMFEPGVLARAGVTSGLVLVATDHGFNLGHDPAVQDPKHAVLVARALGDAHDRWLYDALDRPPTYRYLYEVRTGHAELVRYVPPESGRFEAELRWPAELARGSAYPIHFPCASGGAALRLFPGTLDALSLPAQAGLSTIEVGWVSTRAGISELTLGWRGVARARYSALGPGCTQWRLPGPPPNTSPTLEVELVAGEGALDYIQTN